MVCCIYFSDVSLKIMHTYTRKKNHIKCEKSLALYESFNVKDKNMSV